MQGNSTVTALTRVPPGVHDENVGGHCEVESYATRLQRDEEHLGDGERRTGMRRTGRGGQGREGR